MRSDPERLRFEITARDGAARAGRLHVAHGTVETPAFIPLATRGSVRSLAASEVRELGYELVLGNTFHLHAVAGAGAGRGARGACIASWAGGARSSPTRGDSRSSRSAHGAVADEIKGRRGRPVRPGDGARDRRAGGALPLLPGRVRAVPRARGVDGACRRALGSDIALTFDECTPYHADRDYTARSMERTHRWLDRCLDWHEREGPAPPGGVRDRPGRRPRGPPPASPPSGSSAAADRRRGDRGDAGPRQGRDARRGRDDRAPSRRRGAPRHLLGIGEPDDLVEGIALRRRPVRLRGANAPGPPRDGPRAAARRERSGSTSAAPSLGRRGPARRGLPVPDLRRATAAPTSTTSRAPRS